MVKKSIMKFDPLQRGPSLAQRATVSIPYRQIPIDELEADPNQPRVHFSEKPLAELAESIRRYGILNPILVRPSQSSGLKSGKYKIIAGERRYRAARLIGLKEVPVIVQDGSEDNPDQVLSLQLVENLQREELTPLERSHAIAALKEAFNLSIREVAERVGISKSNVQRSLDLLDLPDDLMNALRQGLSESKVLELAKIEDTSRRRELLQSIDSVSREELREITRPAQANATTAKSGKSPSGRSDLPLGPEERRIVDEMQRALGVKVKMKILTEDASKGQVIVDFYSHEDLQEFFRKIVAD